ncbi:MAG: hypothetical protein WCQ77_02680 [Planctomycetota bacterium]
MLPTRAETNAVSVGANQLVSSGRGPKASHAVKASHGTSAITGTRIAAATSSLRSQSRLVRAAAAVNVADQSRQAAMAAA